jgi:hypothetical protein
LADPSNASAWLARAERGDVLLVSIDDMVDHDYSSIAIGGRRGESSRWLELWADSTTKVFRRTLGPSGTMRNGTLQFNDQIRFPLKPLIGPWALRPTAHETIAPVAIY